MKIYQVLPTIMLGDGVSHEVMEIEKVLSSLGYENGIYADSIVTPSLRKKVVFFSLFPETKAEDIIIYHLSTGSRIVDKLLDIPGKLVIIYHNITPSKWFTKYDKNLELACKKGREDIMKLATRAKYCIADSEYNAQELRDCNYTCPISVLPIVLDFAKFSKHLLNKEHKKVESSCNVLFTGRVVPNKKIEDVIETFYYVQKYFIPDACLNLVGSYSGDGEYYKMLSEFAQKLGVKNVTFWGHIPEEKLVELYSEADCYLSLSEHEGFCIPLLEAMYFHIPVIAYDMGAVSETMENAGILVKDKDKRVIAGIISYLMSHQELRTSIVEAQDERLANYMQLKQEDELKRILNEIVGI